MKTKPTHLLHAALLLSAFSLQAFSLSTPAATSRWQKELAAFEAQDRATPPAQGGVLFLGSSSIRLWKTLAADFPAQPVLNRGFGGSQISDSVENFDKLVLPSKPRLVVFFAGSNDINAGLSAEQVAANFRALCAKLRKTLPDARLIYISIPLVESRWSQRAEVALANTYISAYCRSDPKLTYVDMTTRLLTPEGAVRPEYYQPDKLHMTPEGYALWTQVLRPLLTK